MDSSGSSLIYSTFIGGSNFDGGRTSIALDASKNVYLTSISNSTDYPTTSGAYDKSYSGGGSFYPYGDVVVTKLNQSASSVIYSTYIGGSGCDIPFDIEVDQSGNAFITGNTEDHTTDYPTTTGAYDTSHNGGVYQGYFDSFVTKLNSNGSSLVYSTFIGGSRNDNLNTISIDSYGNAYLTGSSGSTDFPITNDAYDNSINGKGDVIITKLNSSGSSLNYSTYIGGSSGDSASGIFVDSNNNYFLLGSSVSTDYPTTSGSYDTTYNGNSDVFITKLNLTVDSSPPFFGSDCSNTSATTGDPFCFSIEVDDNFGVEEVCVEYWYENGSHKNKTMSGWGTYTHNISIQSGSTDSLYYIFHAMDGSENWNQTSKVKLAVTDNDAPLMGLDNSDHIPTTGDPFSFSMKVKDNIGINSVFVEYWFGNNPHKNESMTGSLIFYHTLNIPSNSLDTLCYIFRAVDPAGNWNHSDQFNKTVKDNDCPVFLSDDSDISAENGKPFTFFIDVLDNIQIDKIFLEYWFGNNEHNNISLDGTSPFTYTIDVPLDSLEILHYVFYVNDTSGNWNQTLRVDIPVIDNIKPLFGIDNSDKTATTGDVFEFSIDIADNIGISNVMVEYWYGEGEISNISMEGSGTFTNSTIIPSGETYELHYKFSAVDISGNWATTPQVDLPVTDNDPPIFNEDRTEYEVATGANLSFLIEVTDNIETSDVYIEYWLGTGVHTNSSMEKKSGFYLYTILIPTDSLYSVYYKVYARDDSGNWVESLTNEVEVIDTIPPEASAGPDITVDEGSSVKIEASDSLDNIGIELYTWTFKGRESDPYYGSVMQYKFKDPGTYILILNVSDSTGNWDTDSVTITVIDVTSPTADPGFDKEVNEGTKVMFDGLGSSDNVGITNYTWTFEYDLEEKILYGFLPSFTFDIPGVYIITLKVSDAAGNYQENILNITVKDITDPIANAGSDQTVQNGTKVIFNGSLSSDNGIITTYSWSFNYDGNEQFLEGKEVSFTFEMAGVYDVILTVKDQFDNKGEDAFKVTVEEVEIPDNGKEEPGEEKDKEEEDRNKLPFGMIVIPLVLLIVVIVIILFFIFKKKSVEEEMDNDKISQKERLNKDQGENNETLLENEERI